MALYVCERKTTAEDITPGALYWQRLVMDSQISLYIEAARSLGYDVHGVLYDVLRKPALRPLLATPEESRKYTKKGQLYAAQRAVDESPEEYGERVLAAIVEDPNRYYQRQIVVRLEQESIDAQADVWQTAGNIREGRRLRVFPRNPDSCLTWGRACDYFPICSGITGANDTVLFAVQPRAHEELDSDAPRDDKALLLLTQSSMRAYRSCPRKYYYRYEQCLRSTAPKAEPLRRGTSIHRGLEVWSKAGGDLKAAIGALDQEDPHSFAFERAMLIGYHARWEHPGRVVAVEKEFRVPLSNPETGASSRTFELGGKVDVLVDIDPTTASVGADVQQKMLTEKLEASVALVEGAIE